MQKLDHYVAQVSHHFVAELPFATWGTAIDQRAQNEFAFQVWLHWQLFLKGYPGVVWIRIQFMKVFEGSLYEYLRVYFEKVAI